MKATGAAPASTHEQEVLRLARARARTLLRARDLTQQGLPTIALTRQVQAGKLERVARGLYGLPGAEMSGHRSLAEVSARVPKGVVCLLSALRVHEIGTPAPPRGLDRHPAAQGQPPARPACDPRRANVGRSPAWPMDDGVVFDATSVTGSPIRKDAGYPRPCFAAFAPWVPCCRSCRT